MRGVERLERLGCEVREISLPHTDYAIGAYYIICTPSQLEPGALRRRALHLPLAHSQTLGDMYRNTRGEGFGAECKRRIMLALMCSAPGITMPTT